MRDPAAYTFNASRYLPPLTGVRALAALLVLAMHTEQNVPAALEAILAVVARGYLRVGFLATDLLVVAHAAVLFCLVERPARTRLRDRIGSFKTA